MTQKGTAILREINQKSILSYLRKHKICSRKDLVDTLGVSKNTVSIIIDQLMKEGIVKEIGLEENQGVGRPRKLITLEANAFTAIGFALKKSKCQYYVINYYLEVLEQGEFVFTSEELDHRIDTITRLAEALCTRYPQTLSFSITIPGLVNPETGLVHESTHSQWKHVNIKEMLENKLSIPVHVLNTVKASAFGAIEKMSEEDFSSAFYIRIEEGVGGAFIIENKIYNGISWSAGEFGHISVLSDGPLCNCGQKGCIETLISLPVFKNAMENMNLSIPDDLIQNPLSESVEKLLSQYGEYLGVGITLIIHLMNPEAIIIESPYNLVKQFREGTMQSIRNRALKLPFSNTNIQFIQNPYASAYGAAVNGVLKYEEV